MSQVTSQNRPTHGGKAGDQTRPFSNVPEDNARRGQVLLAHYAKRVSSIGRLRPKSAQKASLTSFQFCRTALLPDRIWEIYYQRSVPRTIRYLYDNFAGGAPEPWMSMPG